MYADINYFHSYLNGNPVISALPFERFNIYAEKASIYLDEVTRFKIREVTDNIKNCCVELAVEMYNQEQVGGSTQSGSIGGFNYSLAQWTKISQKDAARHLTAPNASLTVMFCAAALNLPLCEREYL